MAKALKKLATHKEVENALDLQDEKREKIKKLQTFDLDYFNGKSCLNVKEFLDIQATIECGFTRT